MPLPRRWKTLRTEPILWLAQAIIAVFRVYARGLEVFGSREKRVKARRFRVRMAGIESVSSSAQGQIQQGNLSRAYDNLRISWSVTKVLEMLKVSANPSLS